MIKKLMHTFIIYKITDQMLYGSTFVKKYLFIS